MVCHRLQLVDSAGMSIASRLPGSIFEGMEVKDSQLIHASRKDFLERSVSSVLCPGPAACITRRLADKALPIPTRFAEDAWLQFCAVAGDGFFYLHEVLTNYRVHDSASHSVGMSWKKRFLKISNRIKNASKGRGELLSFAQAILNYLDGLDTEQAILAPARGTAERICDIGCREVEASASGRLSGAYKLTKMFFTDMRYRRNGLFSFLTHLANILLYSKKKRRKDLGIF